MTTLFANGPRLDGDTLAQWLDEVGIPIALAGAVMTMAAVLV